MLQEKKTVLSIFAFALSLIFIIALLSSFWPKQEKWFIELGLLGNYMTADEYFSNGNSTIDIGTSNDWFIYVHNHLGIAQNVNIKSKLLNSTMELPDDRKHQFSHAPSFEEYSFSLSANETVFLPFSWSIIEIGAKNNSVTIKRLLINQQQIDVDVSDSENLYFRIVFELWVQDPISKEYRFGWDSEDGFSSASNYIGFRVNS